MFSGNDATGVDRGKAMNFLRLAAAAVLWLALSATIPAATERYVSPYGKGIAPFTDWENAATNIQDAVNACAADDVVWVTNGTYKCLSNSTANGYTAMITVTQAITVQSIGGPGLTIVDANFPEFTNRCFYIANGACISGFTITNGHTCDDNSGGGVFSANNCTITNCWITGNSVTNGTSSTYAGGGGVYI